MAGVEMKVVIRNNPTKVLNKRLKSEDYLLGNISRRGADSIAIAVKRDEFRRAIKESKESTEKAFKLVSDEGAYDVRLKEIQMYYADVDAGHIDFQLA